MSRRIDEKTQPTLTRSAESLLDCLTIRFSKREMRWIAILLGLLVLAACSAAETNCDQDTFVVTHTEDLNNGQCDEAHCSLREPHLFG